MSECFRCGDEIEDGEEHWYTSQAGDTECYCAECYEIVLIGEKKEEVSTPPKE